LFQTECLKWYDREACAVEQQLANLFVRVPRQLKLRGQINRALRRDRAYGQSVAAHLLESVVEQIEPQLQLANHVLVIAINVLAHAEESSDGDLLGARGPGAHVAENVAHARSNVRRRDAPADAQPGRGERF